jgi:hypothetical protein
VRPCAPPTGANRSTHWCESLHQLVRIAPPTGANRSTNWCESLQPLPPEEHDPSLRAPARPPHPSFREKATVHPGFSPLDSGSRWQTAPQSPRWLIGLPSVPKPSPAKGFSTPAATPAPPSRSRPCHFRQRCPTDERLVNHVAPPPGFSSAQIAVSGIARRPPRRGIFLVSSRILSESRGPVALSWPRPRHGSEAVDIEGGPGWRRHALAEIEAGSQLSRFSETILWRGVFSGRRRS